MCTGDWLTPAFPYDPNSCSRVLGAAPGKFRGMPSEFDSNLTFDFLKNNIDTVTLLRHEEVSNECLSNVICLRWQRFFDCF